MTVFIGPSYEVRFFANLVCNTGFLIRRKNVCRFETHEKFKILVPETPLVINKDIKTVHFFDITNIGDTEYVMVIT